MHFPNPGIAKHRDAKPAFFVRSNARSSRSQSIDVPLRPASGTGISHNEVGLGHSDYFISQTVWRLWLKTARNLCVKFFQLRNHSHWVGYFGPSGENLNEVTILSYRSAPKDERVKNKTIFVHMYGNMICFLFGHHWQNIYSVFKGNKKIYKLGLGSWVCGICVFHCTSSARRISTGGECQRSISKTTMVTPTTYIWCVLHTHLPFN